MGDEIDTFEQALRHRDARTTMLTSVLLLVAAAVFLVGWALAFAIVRDAEATVTIPLIAIWGPPVGAFVFAAAGFKRLRDGIRKRRDAMTFDQQLRGPTVRVSSVDASG